MATAGSVKHSAGHVLCTNLLDLDSTRHCFNHPEAFRFRGLPSSVGEGDHPNGWNVDIVSLFKPAEQTFISASDVRSKRLQLLEAKIKPKDPNNGLFDPQTTTITGATLETDSGKVLIRLTPRIDTETPETAKTLLQRALDNISLAKKPKKVHSKAVRLAEYYWERVKGQIVVRVSLPPETYARLVSKNAICYYVCFGINTRDGGRSILSVPLPSCPIPLNPRAGQEPTDVELVAILPRHASQQSFEAAYGAGVWDYDGAAEVHLIVPTRAVSEHETVQFKLFKNEITRWLHLLLCQLALTNVDLPVDRVSGVPYSSSLAKLCELAAGVCGDLGECWRLCWADVRIPALRRTQNDYANHVSGLLKYIDRTYGSVLHFEGQEHLSCTWSAEKGSVMENYVVKPFIEEMKRRRKNEANRQRFAQQRRKAYAALVAKRPSPSETSSEYLKRPRSAVAV